MTTRLSIISLAGMARTLVAVGTSSDAFMFLTTAAAAPRSTWFSSPAPVPAAAAGLAAAAGFAGAAASAAAGLGAAGAGLASGAAWGCCGCARSGGCAAGCGLAVAGRLGGRSPQPVGSGL